MFLLRSAFWLALAFIIIRPDADMGQTAAELSDQALAQGSAFVAQQIEAIDCDSLECHGGKIVAAAVLQSHAAEAFATPSAPQTLVPLPRPRPDRLI